MGKLVCPYCRTEATDAIGVKRREPRQKHYVFGMAEPYYMHSEGVPYSKKDSFKPKGGEESPCLQPRLCRVFQHPLERALNRRARNALAFPGISSPIPEKQRSSSACSARGHITAFGLYCPLSGQAFAAAFFFDINNSQWAFDACGVRCGGSPMRAQAPAQ